MCICHCLTRVTGFFLVQSDTSAPSTDDSYSSNVCVGGTFATVLELNESKVAYLSTNPNVLLM